MRGLKPRGRDSRGRTPRGRESREGAEPALRDGPSGFTARLADGTSSGPGAARVAGGAGAGRGATGDFIDGAADEEAAGVTVLPGAAAIAA